MIKAFFRKYVYYLGPRIGGNPHVREYSPEELKSRFFKNGFVVEKIESGPLRVPHWILFEKLPLLLLFWQFFDEFLDKIPYGMNLKQNFILSAKK